MQSPARSAAYRRMPRQKTQISGRFIFLAVAVGVLIAAVVLGKENRTSHTSVSNQTAASVPADPSKPVHLVFDPPTVHNDLQDDNQKLAVDVVTNPSSRGLFDKTPIAALVGNALQVWLSNLETENHFYHYNSNGDVQLSYTKTSGETPCCVGIGMINRDTSACPGWELKDIRRNLYCSGVIFNDYYQEYKVKAPDRVFELTVARYKNAVLLDEDGYMVLDSDGLPIIPGDPDDPESPRSQVNRVFIDPDTGKSMFRFVTD